jgi:hypothetical protein
MAVSTKLSNYFKEMLLCGQINFGLLGVDQGTPHTFKLMLMDNAFTFDEDNHSFVSDIEFHELAIGNGYDGAITLNPLTIARNNTLDKLTVSWGMLRWDITDDGIRTNGAIVYDDTPDPYDNKIIVGYLNFGGEKVTYNQGVFTITNGMFVLL